MTKTKIQIVKLPYFAGSEELKNLILSKADEETKGKACSEYPIDSLEDLKEDLEKGMQEELEAVINETKESGFDYIRVEN